MEERISGFKWKRDTLQRRNSRLRVASVSQIMLLLGLGDREYIAGGSHFFAINEDIESTE